MKLKAEMNPKWEVSTEREQKAKEKKNNFLGSPVFVLYLANVLNKK